MFTEVRECCEVREGAKGWESSIWFERKRKIKYNDVRGKSEKIWESNSDEKLVGK